MGFRSWTLSFFLLAATSSCTFEPLPREGLECPCKEGFTCDSELGICFRGFLRRDSGSDVDARVDAQADAGNDIPSEIVADVQSDVALDVGPPIEDVTGSPPPEPVARWRINEATSGQSVFALVDDTPMPINLPIAYAGASPLFAGTSSSRHLRFSAAPGTATGRAQAVTTSTKLDAVHGSSSATIETKHQFSACTDADGRIFQLADGDFLENGWFGVRENGGAEILAINFALSASWSTYQFDVEGSSCLTDAPHVYHWVVDTMAASPSDRVRVYVDGVRRLASLTMGGAVSRGETINLGTGERRATIGASYTGTRTLDARIYFVAVYLGALTDEQIADRAGILAANDD